MIASSPLESNGIVGCFRETRDKDESWDVSSSNRDGAKRRGVFLSQQKGMDASPRQYNIEHNLSDDEA
jgi:hypothetical protein